MKKLVPVLVLFVLMSGCASREAQIRQVLADNPKIIFDVMEENPEQFIHSVNIAARKAQEAEYKKQMAQMKSQEEFNLKNPKHPDLDQERRLSGDTESEITIVEYADFQCPACRMAYQSLNQLKQKYKGKIQFYYKHMPLDFHTLAEPASRYFEAMKMQNKDKALRFFDYVFQNQSGMTSEAFLKQAAQKVGANLAQLQKDYGSERISQLISKDKDEFQNFGFTGTPVILINGVAMQGAQSLEQMERIIRLTSQSQEQHELRQIKK